MLKQILISMRPQQWSKNLFIFAAIIFTGNLFNLSLLSKSILAFIIFCVLSGAVYIINDLTDIEYDRSHPKKKNRPIASGNLKQRPAFWSAILMTLVGLSLSFLLPINFLFCALTYLLLILSYSLFLKSFILLDVITVSLGFVLRLSSGGFAISIISSPWSLIMTFFLAIFISLIKRRSEKDTLAENAPLLRKNLRYYSKEYLDYLIIISSTNVIISYTLFALFSGKNTNLFITIPFVLYGALRYLYLSFECSLGGDPAILFIKDRPLFYNILIWVGTTIIIIYFT